MNSSTDVNLFKQVLVIRRNKEYKVLFATLNVCQQYRTTSESGCIHGCLCVGKRARILTARTKKASCRVFGTLNLLTTLDSYFLDVHESVQREEPVNSLVLPHLKMNHLNLVTLDSYFPYSCFPYFLFP
jgi:hypothetical protein